MLVDSLERVVQKNRFSIVSTFFSPSSLCVYAEVKKKKKGAKRYKSSPWLDKLYCNCNYCNYIALLQNSQQTHFLKSINKFTLGYILIQSNCNYDKSQHYMSLMSSICSSWRSILIPRAIDIWSIGFGPKVEHVATAQYQNGSVFTRPVPRQPI